MNNNTYAEQIKRVIIAQHEQVLDNFECVYIFGAARLGLKCAHSCRSKGIEVKGFIDNNKDLQGKNIEGINVYSLDYYLDTNKSEPIVIATLNYWSEFEEQLTAQGLNNYLHYNILHIWDAQSFSPAEECFDGIIEDISFNMKKYEDLRECLADEMSRIILDELLKFRMTMEIRHTRKAYSLSMGRGNQYFDSDIINLEDQEVFIDGGAYRGETSKVFIAQLSMQCKEYQHIYVFEPDSNLIKVAQKQLEIYKNITYCPVGLSNRSEVLRFNNTGDTGGAFDSNGQIEIALGTVDNSTHNNASFIKLDIEGFEEKALIGAVNTIRKCKPKMAISAYNKSGDIWRLVEAVRTIRSDYKVYLRHYTPSYFDTVLYFI